MNQNHLRKLALGAAIAGSLAAVSAAQANPFSLTTLGNSYMAAAGDDKASKPEAEMKCGAAKEAAGDKAKGEMKCGEGKCGAKKEGEKKEDDKKSEQA